MEAAPETAVVDGRARGITLRFLAEPGDVNFGGKVHGGAVMRWIDQAGYACAVGWSGHYCVTAYVGGIRFLRPIVIGQVVEVSAQVVYTGRTSMHVEVGVRAGDLREGGMTPTTHCTMVFVAVSSTGGPVPVHRWTPRTPEDVAHERRARKQMELRQAMEAALATPAA
jgi:acyl-CoA hydrolase